jgi:hypothetical protein
MKETALVQALIALAEEPERRRRDLAAVLSAAPEGVGRLAVDHGIAGVAYAHARHLQDHFPDLLAELDAARRQAWINHRTTVADLSELAPVFDKLGAPWAVVKGPVLVERAYGRADLRSYYDLDILVEPAAYGDALTALVSEGAFMIDNNWALIRSSRRAELSLCVRDRTIVDLHWHLLNEVSLRRATRWDMHAVLGRAFTADVGPARVPVLDPADAVMHLAVHACLAGGHRMVWLKDIERQLVKYPVPRDLVEQRAREAGLWPPTDLALTRAEMTFDLAADGHQAPWTRVNRWLGTDRFRLSDGFLGNGRTLASATRATVARSAGAVGAIVARDQVLPWGRSRGLGRWLPAPPPSVEDLQRHGGSPRDRQAYLQMVAAQ